LIYSLSQYSLQGGRKSNQDRIAYAERENSILMVLADGLGGHRGGDVAAEVFTESVIRSYLGIKNSFIKEPSAFLALAMLGAHHNVLAQRDVLGDNAKPRTTGVACLVQDGYAYWAHVGDSRLYHIRGGTVIERTRDHSVVERMYSEGLIAKEEIRTHPQKSHITQCIGSSNKPKITLGKETRLHTGDYLLLCSDGVWEGLPSPQLAAHLENTSIEEAVENILHTVEDKMGAGCDNISIIALKWQDRATTKPPLQKGFKTEITEDVLREQAMAKSRRRAASKPEPDHLPADEPDSATTEVEPAHPDKRKDIGSEIAELEDFLKKKSQK